MLNEFLDILKGGYTVEFSENNTLGMTEITVKKNGNTAMHSVNLDHLKEFGIEKEVALVCVIRQLMVELDQRKMNLKNIACEEVSD